LILSGGDRREVNECSLEILQTLGVKLESQAIREKLIEFGAKTSAEKDAVYLPRDLVEERLKRAPSSIRLENLDGESVVLSPGGRSVFWTCNALYIVKDRGRREITSSDFVDLTRIADSLENVHAMVGTSMADHAPQTRDFVGFRLMAENTGKHLRPCIFTF
jgi:trimethylamine:corrinoid methyltransferase-like protein